MYYPLYVHMYDTVYLLKFCPSKVSVLQNTGPAQPVRLVRFWPDQYLEVTSNIYFGLLREGSTFEESVTAPSII